MSRRSSRKKKKDLQGYMILAVCAAALGLLGVGYIHIKGSYIERDKNTLCRSDGVVSRETALVLDATDSFSEAQALILKKRIRQIVEASHVDERFTTYILRDHVDGFRPAFSVCNPGDGQDKSELTANKRKLFNAWKNNFVGKIEDSLDNILKENTAVSSPIMEMIKYASINTMLDSNASQRRMVVVSDLLHHTGKYSHYREKPSFMKLKDTPYGVEVRPYLKDVSLNILYVVRPNHMARQNRGHIGFWEEFVSAGGGQITNVESIN